MGVWKDGLSVDETKFSVFICLLIIVFLYVLYDHYVNGDIALNLLELIKILIFSVAGINVANKVSESLVKSRHEKEEYLEYKRHQEHYHDREVR